PRALDRGSPLAPTRSRRSLAEGACRLRLPTREPEMLRGVHEEGVEPTRLAAPEPKSGASASSATRASPRTIALPEPVRAAKPRPRPKGRERPRVPSAMHLRAQRLHIEPDVLRRPGSHVELGRSPGVEWWPRAPALSERRGPRSSGGLAVPRAPRRHRPRARSRRGVRRARSRARL